MQGKGSSLELKKQGQAMMARRSETVLQLPLPQ
jgi:hypothetical protein